MLLIICISLVNWYSCPFPVFLISILVFFSLLILAFYFSKSVIIISRVAPLAILGPTGVSQIEPWYCQLLWFQTNHTIVFSYLKATDLASEIKTSDQLFCKAGGSGSEFNTKSSNMHLQLCPLLTDLTARRKVVSCSLCDIVVYRCDFYLRRLFHVKSCWRVWNTPSSHKLSSAHLQLYLLEKTHSVFWG